MTERMPAPAPGSSIAPEFAALYREQFGFVWRMLIHFGVPGPAVEDAAQEVFIVVHRRWTDWQVGVSARAWLYGIVRRVAADQRRSQHRHARKLEALPTPPRGRDVEAEVAERELIDALEQALTELDAKQRDAFVLSELEGMTAKEIADAVGANPNTVASRLRAARSHVSERLAARREPKPERNKRHA